MKESSSVRVTTLVDNEVWRKGLASVWGLSLYVEMDVKRERHVILMDTSGSFETFSKNVLQLDVDLSAVEAIFHYSLAWRPLWLLEPCPAFVEAVNASLCSVQELCWNERDKGSGRSSSGLF